MTTYLVPMRDGVTLATEILLPNGEGPWPLLLARTPYSRRQLLELAGEFTTRGYGVMLQDVRGTGDSAGQFGFLGQEPADALDTAHWLLAQPWCDGRFGILGISYMAAASIAIAAELPERVKACVWITMPLCREWLGWENGAMRLHHALPWTMLTHGISLRGRDWAATYLTLPLADAAKENPLWQVFAENENPEDPFWQANNLRPYLDRVRAPGLHAEGWYCFLNYAAITPYRRLNAVAGAPQRLIMGPWSHNEVLDVVLPEIQAWFDHWFKGVPDHTSPVRVRLIGEAGWRDLPAWPEPSVPLYLAPNGRLTSDAPVRQQDTFTADPLDPVPTQGGAVWEFPPAGLVPGPVIQTTAGRPDVLTYDTEPLTERLPLCGTVRLELTAGASTPSADFTAKLCDVAPDGTARYICDGIAREPGALHTFAIDMHCGHLLKAGHRLRLEVAGANFPKYDRNLQHGGSPMHSGAECAVPSRHTVELGPSRLLLPELFGRSPIANLEPSRE